MTAAYDEALVSFQAADEKLSEYQAMLERAAVSLRDRRGKFWLESVPAESGSGVPNEVWANNPGMHGPSFPDAKRIMKALAG